MPARETEFLKVGFTFISANSPWILS